MNRNQLTPAEFEAMVAAVSISKCNRKTGDIASFSLPPVTTCRNGAPCVNGCYAIAMMNRFPSVRRAWERNLEIWETCPEAVIERILRETATLRFFRWFIGGDIPSFEFYAAMVQIALERPDCEFLCFTKRYEIVNQYTEIFGLPPKNLHIVFSAWGNALRPVNPYNFPVSDLYDGHTFSAGEFLCPGNCQNCIIAGLGCWIMKYGERVYFDAHGAGKEKAIESSRGGETE